MGPESSFSIMWVLSHGGEDVLKNAEAQALGYSFGVLSNQPLDPIKFLPPLISYGPDAYDFITQATGSTRIERVLTRGFILSGTSLLRKTGDIILNASAGAFLYLIAQYVESMAKSDCGGGPDS